MGKIFYIMGKSSSGKDTIYRKLQESENLKLGRLVLYTTRPIRDGEKEGQEYHFVDEAKYFEFNKLKQEPIRQFTDHGLILRQMMVRLI